jgi:capsular exopolysaccharide synthesis family protein
MADKLWIQIEPLGKFSEAIRAARESLFSHLKDEPNPVVVLCAPHRGDGASTIAANLAASIAHLGKKVLLIDSDLTGDGLTQFMSPDSKSTFTNAMESGNILPVPTNIENLDFLASGTATSGKHPFDSPNLQAVFEKLKTRYNIILIDTSPILESSDAVVLGQKASGVILIFMAGNYLREDEISSREILERSGVRIIGAIMNRIRGDQSDPYYTYQRFLELREYES